MSWYDWLIAKLKIGQKKADEFTEAGEQVIKKGFSKVDEYAHVAADKIEDAMKPVNELGAKYGGTGNPKGMGKDLK